MSEAFWLTVVTVNLYFITQEAFRSTGVWQGFMFALLGVWMRLTYREIRRATRARRDWE